MYIKEVSWSSVVYAELRRLVVYEECEECMECRFVVCSPAARRSPTDLSEMNTRSAPFHEESTCQFSYPYAQVFEMISWLKNSNKNKENMKKLSENIMVAART
jgi:hypothetical protein